MRSFNKKSKLLIGGVILLTLVSYHLAFRKTLSSLRTYHRVEKIHKSGTAIGMQMQNLKIEETQLDEELKSFNVGGKSQQSNLLKFLNEQLNGSSVRVQEFLAPHKGTMGDEIIKTYRFTLKGDFIGILKVINALETQKGFGAVSHINFQKIKNYRSGKSELLATVFVSHFE